jgi:type IV secretory pathway VirB9-like protein
MRHRPIAVAALLFLVSSAAYAQTTRDVMYNSRSIVQVNARLRFTTLIILPQSEEILDFVCGDKDFWIVSGAENLAYVKPAKAGASTNLNLVTASGNVYSFLLTEGVAEPDLKLYVTGDETMKAALNAPPKFYSAAQMEEFKRAAEDARKQAADARTQAEAARTEAEAAKADAARSIEDRVSTFRSTYPTGLHFPYVVKGNGAPFNVVAIYHDDRFTYIRANASELPSLYERQDDQPSLINFQIENGVYVVPKILDSGYLVIGQKRLVFERAK